MQLVHLPQASARLLGEEVVFLVLLIQEQLVGLVLHPVLEPLQPLDLSKAEVEAAHNCLEAVQVFEQLQVGLHDLGARPTRPLLLVERSQDHLEGKPPPEQDSTGRAPTTASQQYHPHRPHPEPSETPRLHIPAVPDGAM